MYVNKNKGGKNMHRVKTKEQIQLRVPDGLTEFNAGSHQ
jgi:hypothetical protein